MTVQFKAITDGGTSDIRNERYEYWAPQTTGAAVGSTSSPSNSGPAATQRTYAGGGTGELLSVSKRTYDRWGNVLEVGRQLDATRWVVDQTTYDYRNRPLQERYASCFGPYENGALKAWDSEIHVKESHYNDTRLDRQRLTVRGEGTNMLGPLVEFTYARNGLLLAQTGYPSSLNWTASGQDEKLERRLERDAFGNVVQEAVRIDPAGPGTAQWRVTRRTFNAADQIVEETVYAEPFIGAAPPSLATSLERPYASTRVWYQNGLPTWIQSFGVGDQGEIAKIGTVKREYDGHDRLVKNRVCADGQLTSPPTCINDRWLSETELRYDAEDRVTDRIVRGRVSGTDDPLSYGKILGWQRFVYDDRGRTIRTQTAQSTGGAVLAEGCTTCTWITSWSTYDAEGRPLTTSRATSATTYTTTSTTYDELGRAKTTTDAVGNVTTVVSRNLLGLPERLDVLEVGTNYQSATRTTTFGYDGFGRPTTVDVPGGRSTDPVRTIRRKFDSWDRVLEEQAPLGAANSDAYKTTTDFDGFGRVVRTKKHISGGTWQEQTRTYDRGGRVLTMSMPVGSITQETTYGYDAVGRVVWRRMPDGKAESVVYDGAGRPLKMERRSGGVPGNVCGTGGLECVALDFSYDTAGRKSSLTVDLANAGTSAGHYAGTHGVTYGWDGLGRLVAATDDNGDGTDVSIERVYDSTGAVLSETSTIGDVPLAVASRYDLAGRRDRVTYPGGKVVDVGYDALSRVTTLDLDAATIASNTWFGVARRVETDFPLDGVAWRAWSGGQSGGVRVPSYDAAGRRTDGRVEPRTGTGTPFFAEHFAYDENDRVTQTVWTHVLDGNGAVAPRGQQYTFDELDRLTGFAHGPAQASGSGGDTTYTITGVAALGHAWTLDQLGNWTTHTDGTAPEATLAPTAANAYPDWKEDADGNGVLETRTLGYDGIGGFLYERPTATGRRRYTHDALGRLVQVDVETDGTGQPPPPPTTRRKRYGWDPLGRLAWSHDSGTNEVTRYVHDGRQVVEERVAGAARWTNVWMGSALVATIDHATAGTPRYIVTQDRLGSVATVTAQGALRERRIYDAYGRPIAEMTTAPASGDAVPYGYTGARWDEVAQLSLMGARWYDPQMGRFIERDPAGERGGMNLYAYVESSPVMWVDPTGLARAPAFPPPEEYTRRALATFGGFQGTGGGTAHRRGGGLKAVSGDFFRGGQEWATTLAARASSADGHTIADRETSMESTAGASSGADESADDSSSPNASVSPDGSTTGASRNVKGPDGVWVQEVEIIHKDGLSDTALGRMMSGRDLGGGERFPDRSAELAKPVFQLYGIGALGGLGWGVGLYCLGSGGVAGVTVMHQTATAAELAAAAEAARRAAPLVARGGAAAVRAGQAGEAAVRATADIGPSSRIIVNGATRIPDGLTDTVLSEVKNVGSLSYTQQLRDYAHYAAENGLRFDLFVRPGAELSGPLQQAVTNGSINLLPIPPVP